MVGAALAVVASVVLAGSALAAGFTNGGFEGTSVATGGTYQDGGSGFMPGVTGATIPGWTITGQVDWIGSYWTAAEGSYSIDMNATPTQGTLSQTFDTVLNSTYSVQFELSGNPNCGTGDKTLLLTYPGGSQSYTYTVTSANSNTNMLWTTPTAVSFVGTGSPATISFASTSTGACGAAIDNVTVTPTAASGAHCKKGGWATMYDENGVLFKNQGDCVSYYATSGAVPIGN